MYSALRIRGCEAAVKRPEYIGTTWSFRDAMYTNFVCFRILSRVRETKEREGGDSHHGPTHYPKPAHSSSILDFPYSTNSHQRSHRQKKNKRSTNLKLKQLPSSDTLKILQIRSHKGARAKVPQRPKMDTAQGKDTHSLVFPYRIMHIWV